MKYLDPVPLPLVHVDVEAIHLTGGHPYIVAARHNHELHVEEQRPNLIRIDADAFPMITSSTYLTPTMIVHIANELLTDEERAFIRVPVTVEGAAS